MIAHLRGEVAHRDAGTVVVDVNGVGYLVHVTPAEPIPARGERVELFTSLQVREDALTLYGFADRAALSLFELLLGSSGVGPKLALAALGTLRPDALRVAIAGGDVAALTAIPGVGRKVAERLVLELKDRVGTLGVPVTPSGAAAGALDDGVAGDVRDALLGLGYSSPEVVDALARVGDGEADADAATLLRLALRHLGQASNGSATPAARR